jgi:hypothetical protein
MAETAHLGPPTVNAGEDRVRPSSPKLFYHQALPQQRQLHVSFTQLRLLEECPQAWFLSRQTSAWPEAEQAATEVEASLVGSRFHQFAAIANRRGLAPRGLEARDLLTSLAKDLEPPEAERLRALVKGFLASQWAQPEKLAEVERPLRLLRQEDSCLVEINGVADLFLPSTGRLVDYKTEAVLTSEGRAAHALQMHIYREALRTEGRMSPVETIIAHVQPGRLDSVPLSDRELAAQAPRLERLLRDLIALMNGAKPESRPSRRCEYCEFAACCPEAPICRTAGPARL